MAGNTFKIDSGKRKKGNSVFSKIETLLKVDRVFEEGVPVKYLPYILFIAIIGLFYIGNSHHAEKTIRKIDKLQVEVEDLRADFTTLKAEYMFASKQSEVAKNVKELGLNESLKPPYKVEVEKSEH